MLHDCISYDVKHGTKQLCGHITLLLYMCCLQDQYIKAYADTGRARLLGRTAELVAQVCNKHL